MATVKLRIPDREEALCLQLQEGFTLLIGREPDLNRLAGSLHEELVGSHIQTVRIPSERVSANHLLLRQDEQGVRVWDLNSRNGSFLRLIPKHPLALPGQIDLFFDLASLSGGTRQLVTLNDAEWTTEQEYPAAIVQSIMQWFQHSGISAQAYIAGTNKSEADGDSLLLADGSLLIVAPPRGATFEVPWRVVIDRVRNYINEQNIRFEQLAGHDEDFILVAPAMRAAHRELTDAAAYGIRLMLLGPTGSGKERLARCYHTHSRQHRGPYATINCALLKESLLYAQLFGAKKGSFTGAVSDVIGMVEAANEGTLFLDEVGEMDLEVQKALLRFLDSRGEYYRLGDSQPRRVNVQIVCATNAPLDDAAARRGRFRDDLWYRLAVKVVRVPPLSERREDILAFLKTRLMRGGQIRAIDALTKGALERVLKDPWPGNFRDLENFIERLPPTPYPNSINEAACEAALREGRGPSGRASRPVSPISSLADGSWPEIAAAAFTAFEEDHGDAPKNWGQLQSYMEKYLKPVFVAQSCGLGQLNELSKGMNYSELARRLNIADGTTVKMHLNRYIERYRKKQSP